MNTLDAVSNVMKKHKNITVTAAKGNRIRVQIVKGSNKIVSIPCRLSEDIAYLIAATMCDGHIRPDKYTIIFENSNKRVIKKFVKKVRDVFETEAKYRLVNDSRDGRMIRYRTEITSKPITILFNEVFGIPRGKKSDIIKVPDAIKNSGKGIKLSFIEGVFDTDGGRRQRGFGLSSASKTFRDDIAEMLSEFGFAPHMDEWINKKYNRKYYGLHFKNLGADADKQKGLNI